MVRARTQPARFRHTAIVSFALRTFHCSEALDSYGLNYLDTGHIFFSLLGTINTRRAPAFRNRAADCERTQSLRVEFQLACPIKRGDCGRLQDVKNNETRHSSQRHLSNARHCKTNRKQARQAASLALEVY